MGQSFAASRTHLGQRVGALRTDAGMSIGALARATGLAKTSISNLEAGTSNPSLETLWSLANALGVSLGVLLSDDAADQVEVIRSGQGALFSSESGLSGRFLLASGPSGRTEVTDTALSPQTSHQSAAHYPGTRELIYCISGDLTVGPLGTECWLTSGDTAIFAADQPHTYASADGAHILVLMSSRWRN